MGEDGRAARAAVAREPVGPAWKPVLQVILVPLAILVVMWLVNVLLLDRPYFGDVADTFSKQTWTVLGIAALAVLLGADLGLLRRPHAPWQREDRGGERVYLIGCKTCGTVFERPESQLSSSRTFRCPNCERMGRLAPREEGHLDVVETVCPTCGNPFRRYRSVAECPTCHTASS